MIKIFALYIFFYIILKINVIDSNSSSNILVRRKRYIAFPEGASFSIAFCLRANTLTSAPTIFTEGVNWVVAYDLPNATFASETVTNFTYAHQRRVRREIYNKIETLIDSMGFDGHSCILRALCETEQKMISNDDNIIGKLFQIFFRFPLQRIHHFEPEIHRFYHRARKMGRSEKNCDSLFPSCQFSLLNLILNLAI